MFITAIIAAGGRGLRLGASQPKQLLDVNGAPILHRSFAAFRDHPRVDEIVVALPPDVLQSPPEYLRSGAKPVLLVAGGARRQDSVANAFDHVAARAEIVVIHDAARPFVTAPLIDRTIEAAAEAGAAVCGVTSRDTVKEIAGADGPFAARVVGRTLPRESLFLAQTPQAFRRSVLADAIARGRQGEEATDEAALAELAGHPVRLVEGDAFNLKITTPEDLAVAHALAGGVGQGERRIGTGYDLHRLVEGRPLILGGVTLPFDRGLAGHSDADVLSHAITDAVLGAASLGNIGSHFPDTDPAWRGASSLDLLRRATAHLRQAGFRVTNVDAVVIAERPKLAPHLDAICANLAAALGIATGRISVKGKTNEGVGEIGRGEAIAAHAVALVEGHAAPVRA
jgi:2-C-methyl-D-erythritol 4-phosphate cytidylyltransferase/2-C-methyl-D-erythritol 2,4-cyclodiphosphate synthase